MAAQQASWRRRNPEYFLARRMRAAAADPDPPSPAAPLDRLPWDDAQTQFGNEGSEFIAGFGRVLLAAAQMQFRKEVFDTS